MTHAHSAGPSALGYYYQAIYALVSLMSQRSDAAAVSLEKADDVVIDHPGGKTLIQLKHKSSPPPALTLYGRDLWKTLAVWSEYVQSGQVIDTQFHLVTVAPIGQDSPLQVLRCHGTSRDGLVDLLLDEASRVMTERAAAARSGERTLPFEDRAVGCAAFSTLTDAQRISLVDAIQLIPDSFDAAAALHTVSSLLLLVPPEIRNRVTNRLIEWWDRQVFMSLTGERSGLIQKSEVQQQLLRLVNEYSEDSLPDNFSTLEPADWRAQLSSVVEKQIRLVNGYDYHYERAARDMWRARNQRNLWLTDNLRSLSDLDEHEIHLVEEWKARHEEVRHLIDNEDCCMAGRSILDWAYKEAWLQTTPIKAKWTRPFLVRGTYHILADKRRVGWHPHFPDILDANDGSDQP